MAMPAAGGEPPRAQKLRIMFKGAKLVEVTAPLRDALGATEAARTATGLKQLHQSGVSGGSAQEDSQLPPDLINFLSREMEECLSPLGSWVDETFANGHQSASDHIAADARPAVPALSQPSSTSLPAKVKEADATQWWEQAAAAGARSSEASSTREGAFMDAPSPGSVSNGFVPFTGHHDGTAQPGMPAWPSSQAAAAPAAGRAAPLEAPSASTAPAQPEHRRQELPEQRHASAPQHQPQHQLQRQHAASKPQQQQKPQPRVQSRPRPKPVDWLAAEATTITASPRRDASPAAAPQQRPVGATALPSQRPKGPGAASNSSAAGSGCSSIPRSATSSPQPESTGARQQSPAAVQKGSQNQKSSSGAKRKGSPEAAHASAAKRSPPAASPARRPAAQGSRQTLHRGTSPLAARSQAPAAPARQESHRLGNATAARPAGATAARAGTAVKAGTATKAGSAAAGRPAAAAAAGAPVLSRGGAAGEPVGGFGAGQWHGFREGQVVWAKMAGFPHWPAQVQAPTPAAQRVREPSMQRPVFVVFFGTADFQWLPASKLTRFGDNYRARAAIHDAQLQQSLDNAWWHLGEPKP